MYLHPHIILKILNKISDLKSYYKMISTCKMIYRMALDHGILKKCCINIIKKSLPFRNYLKQIDKIIKTNGKSFYDFRYIHSLYDKRYFDELCIVIGNKYYIPDREISPIYVSHDGYFMWIYPYLDYDPSRYPLYIEDNDKLKISQRFDKVIYDSNKFLSKGININININEPIKYFEITLYLDKIDQLVSLFN